MVWHTLRGEATIDVLQRDSLSKNTRDNVLVLPGGIAFLYA
jgi:hypothetical protein